MYRRKQCTEGSSVQKAVVTSVQKEAVYRRKQFTEGSSDQCTKGSSLQKEAVTSVQKEAVYRKKQCTEGSSVRKEAVYRRKQCTEGSSDQCTEGSSVQKEAMYRRKQCSEGSSVQKEAVYRRKQFTEVVTSVQKEAVYRSSEQRTEGSNVPRHVAGWCRTGDLTHVRRCRPEEGHDDMVEHQGNIVESQQDQQTKLVAILSTECCYQTIQVLKLHDELSVSRLFTRNPEIQKEKELSY